MVKLFISYRRADSRKDAGRIYDRLVEAFGKDNVFKDVDSIPMGKDFRGILREAVAQCDVQLVIIGRQWLDIKDEHGNRRLDNPGDFVRIEVESALQRDSCLVIPVLVDSASMPPADNLPVDLRELAFKNATAVRDDPDFHHDVSRIIRELQQHYGVDPAAGAKTAALTAVFNVHDAIREFYQAFDERQWERARAILTEIRTSERAPRAFNVDVHEQQVWDAIEADNRDREYDVLRLMAQRPQKTPAWEALQVFWQSYPDYDPDQLADLVRPIAPPPVLKAEPARPATVQPVARDPEPQSPPAAKKPIRLPSAKPPQPKTLTIAESAAAVRAILGDPFDWCEIPAGEFLYGEKKQKMTLPAFWMAKYPVTYSQFQIFIDANDGFYYGRWWQGLPADADHRKHPREQEWKIADHPRTGVSWYDSVVFCRWLSFRLYGESETAPATYRTIRLPTESEWEKAARGTKGLIYPYGNTFDAKKCNTYESGIGKTTPVTQYPQGMSPYGVLDMSGNVWEWCRNDYHNPDLLDNYNNQDDKVLRGGSFSNAQYDAAASYRYNLFPSRRSSLYGLRVVVAAPVRPSAL